MLALALVASIALGGGPQAAPTYALAETPKVGARAVETTRIVYRLLKEPVAETFRTESAVLEIARDGTLTVRETVSERGVRFGSAPEVRNEAPLVRTVRLDRRGNVVAVLDADGDPETNPDPISDTEALPFALDHVALACGYAPKTPVRLGETWTPAMDERLNLYPLAFTLVGEAKGELTLSARGDGREGAKVEATLLLDAATSRRRKTNVRVTGVPIAGPDGEPVSEGVIEVEIVAKP